jgi:transcriptional regulator with XRE-family HTH domain
MWQPAPDTGDDATATARRPADLVDRLNRIRLERDLTYLELATAIGLEQTVVFRFLQRTQKPLERTLYKIRRYVERIERAER